MCPWMWPVPGRVTLRLERIHLGSPSSTFDLFLSKAPTSILRNSTCNHFLHFLTHSSPNKQAHVANFRTNSSTASIIERLHQSKSSIEEICSHEGVPGISFGVLHQGSVAHTDNFGFQDAANAAPTNSDTLYGVGSLTKSMISAGIGKLVENGKLEWNTPVRQLLPRFSHQDSEFAKEVRIGDFLAHRSGLSGGAALDLAFQGDGEMLLPADSLLDIVHHIPRVAAIGETWIYFVWGYSIAGLVIEELTQLPLHQYLQQEIFHTVGMGRTTLRPAFQEANVSKAYACLSDSEAYELRKRQPFAETFFEASGGAYSTVNDLLRWSKATLDAGQEAETPRESDLSQIPEIISPQISIDSLPPKHAYCFGWLRAYLPGVVGTMGGNPNLPVLGSGGEPRLILYHQGVTVGYYSFLALFPETQSAVVVLTNAIAVGDVAGWVGCILIEALFGFPAQADYVRLSKEGKQRKLQRFESMQACFAKEHAPGTRPLPLDAYVGKYVNQTYKSILEVALDPVDNECLVVLFQSLRSQCYRLRHLCGNVFEWALSHDEGKRRGRYTCADASYFKFSFEVSSREQAHKIIWDIDEASQPGGVIFSRLDEEKL